MDALELIRADVGRMRGASARRGALAALLCALGAGTGLLLRRDMIGMNSPSAVVSLLVVGALVAALAALDRGARVRRFGPLVALGLVLVTARWLGGGMAIPYPSASAFWGEATTCFVKGALTAALASAVVAIFVLRLLPLANRSVLVASSALPGGAGLLMLTAHCPSDHLGHIAFGHWLPFLLASTLSYAVFHVLVRRALAPVLARPGLEPHAASRVLR